MDYFAWVNVIAMVKMGLKKILRKQDLILNKPPMLVLQPLQKSFLGYLNNFVV